MAVALGGTCGSWAWERTDHWLAINLASVAADHHFCFRTFLLDRMRVIYRRLQ